MALTNAMLKAMGIENDQRDQIMAAHQEVLESIKKERDELRDKAAKVPDLERQMEELKKAIPSEDWKAKHDKLKDEFEAFKAKTEQDRANAEKDSLYRKALRDAGVAERHIDAIMRVTDLDKVQVADGAIADSDAVMKAIADEWGGFIPQKTTHGANVADPPTNTGGKMTKEEIFAIKDTRERQQAIADNIDVFK